MFGIHVVASQFFGRGVLAFVDRHVGIKVHRGGVAYREVEHREVIVGLQEEVLGSRADYLPVALCQQVAFFAHVHAQMAALVDVEHDVGHVVGFHVVAAPCRGESVVIGSRERQVGHLCRISHFGEAPSQRELSVHPCAVGIPGIGFEPIGIGGIAARLLGADGLHLGERHIVGHSHRT